FVEVKKSVVLAAHGIESSKILLVSDLAKKSGMVGKNLMDHLNGEAVGLYPEYVYPFRGPQGTSSITAFCDHDQRKQFGAFMITLGNDGWGRVEPPQKSLEDLFAAGSIGKELRDKFQDRVLRQIRFSFSTEMLPRETNQVTLSTEADPLGIPRPKIKFTVDDYTKRTFEYAQKTLIAVLSSLGATALNPAVPKYTEYKTAGHIMGTCRMGMDANTSVVNSRGQCWEHPNLFIVGSSVFPTSGTANPTLTIAALTLRTASF